MNKKFFRDLWYDEQLELVQSEADPSWRHGCYMSEVYKDEANRYWLVDYQMSGDGEYNGLRECDFELAQVKPVKKIVEIVEYYPVDNE